jgi:hypothetical protein
MVADRVNRILLSAYGEQDMVTTYQTGLAVRRLYLSTQILPTIARSCGMAISATWWRTSV